MKLGDVEREGKEQADNGECARDVELEMEEGEIITGPMAARNDRLGCWG
jgi:hypothetical protein